MVGAHGRMRRRELTAAEWVRRYLPWGLAGGIGCVVIGLVLMALGR
ncbi:hypothetical protein ATL31_2940 [Phycicoccus duodecadis]|uniref:Uncharacterized protein n=1 Tax=Phycicoccus duodecadis TaxID=173053 RepID=A0A2N3YMJ2_9MICO|nr:hypothetical protein ATL31_2940 [Phycicoccus duodecadis]